MTIPQFSNNLALNFQKIIIVPLINEYIKTIEGNDKSWEFIGENKGTVLCLTIPYRHYKLSVGELICQG